VSESASVSWRNRPQTLFSGVVGLVVVGLVWLTDWCVGQSNEIYHQFLKAKRPPVKALLRTPAPAASSGLPRKGVAKPWLQADADKVLFRNTDEFYADVKLSEQQRLAVAQHRASADRLRRQRRSPALQRALDAYAVRHHAALSGAEQWLRPDVRFVVWRCAAASTPIGEQMESMVSAFLLALLTDRVFLAYGPIVPFFDSPFAAGHSLEHQAFYTRADSPDVLETKLYPLTARAELPRFACGDLRNVTQKVWRLSGQFFFALLLARNVHFQSTLLQWFPPSGNSSGSSGGVAENMFAPLADFLFAVPSREISKRVRVFEEHYFGNVGSTIGMHLRLPRTAEPDDVDVEDLAQRVARCVDVAVMPALRKLRLKPIFFVASAYFDAKTLMSKAFAKDAIVAFNEHGGQALDKTNATALLEAALVEWHLLSRTHDMVISFATPFARTAAAVASVAPIVVDHQSLSCARLNTTDLALIASEEWWMQPGNVACPAVVE
jgi:hypothetical protein